MVVSKEDIKNAKETNLAAYLSSRGEPLVKNGRRFKHKKHDSLVFTDNLYFWNSRQEFGNAIDYLMRNMNMQFTEAVKELCGFNGIHIEVSNPDYEYKKNPFKFEDVEFSNDSKRVIAYLVKTRGLEFKMIVDLIKDGLIAQTKESANIAFLAKDENGKVVGIEYNTTISDRRFKGIEKGSDSKYGFNILNCKANEVQKFFYFESSIDLLSFKQMNKLPEKSIMISMTGLKECVIKNTLEKFGDNSDKKVFICVDKDLAGINFCNSLKGKYNNMKFIMPGTVKDWNESLKKNSVKSKLRIIGLINPAIQSNKKLLKQMER